MNTQILPNWCKKLGIILFIVGTVLGGGDDFIDGLNGIPYKSNEGSKIFSNFLGENLTHLLEVLGILGMLVYMLSKEKIEDDYINQLRLESYQLTAIIGLVISILLYSFSKDLKLTLDYFIILFIWVYLITFFIKKRAY